MGVESGMNRNVDHIVLLDFYTHYRPILLSLAKIQNTEEDGQTDDRPNNWNMMPMHQHQQPKKYDKIQRSE